MATLSSNVGNKSTIWLKVKNSLGKNYTITER